jgi:hypothetical protein
MRLGIGGGYSGFTLTSVNCWRKASYTVVLV